MNEPQTCSNCGASLPPDSTSDQCPDCLGGANTLKASGETVSDSATVAQSGSPHVHGAGSAAKVPTLIEGYELLEELGRGGMGVVYKARQVSLNRDVALKMILAGQFAGEAEIKRFHAEAEAAASLDHPNIVPIYEIGRSDGLQYFSMKLVDGESLSRRIQQYRNDHPAAARLLAKIARAVHYAHQHGILHRDLKPANILLDAQGEPHISDFGLARRIDAEVNLTLSGAVLGTPSYMAPEQASGQTKSLTTTADVYSLGAIFYHLLAGQSPFPGDNPVEILRRVVQDEPPKPTTIFPALDRDLETICLKCLEKDPRRRYGSAEALAEDIERWLRLEPIHARPATTVEQIAKWMRRKPVIAALAGCLLVVGVAGLSGVLSQWMRAEKKAEESRQRLVRLNVVNGVRFAKEGDLAAALLWYTEALRLDQGTGQNEEIHRLRIGSVLQEIPQLRRVWMHPHPVWLAQFSPGEDRIVTISGPEPDAARNRFTQAELRVWDYPTGGAVSPPILFAGGRPRMYRIRYQVFSPDGQKVVTIQAKDTDDEKMISEVILGDARSGQTVAPALVHEGLVSHVAFSPNGRYLVSASSAGTAQVWDLERGAAPIAVLKHDAWVTTASFSPDNQHLVTGSWDKTARIWTIGTGMQEPLVLKHNRYLFDAQFNHDGTRIVTTASDGTGGEFRVWETATGRQICSSENVARLNVLYQASFSPDGRQILTAGYDGNATLWDSATARLLSAPLKHNHGVLMAVFSPDGTRAVTASFDRTARLWSTDGASTASGVLNHCNFVLGVTFSKEGKRVLSVSTDGMARLWELPGPPPDTLTLNHSNAVLHAEFSPDGTRIVTASVDQTARVWDAATGKPISPPLMHSGAVYHAAFSPDARTVITASADGTARLWDAATGQALGPPLLHSNAVWHAEFNRDGSQVVTASGQFRDLAAASSHLHRPFAKPENPHLDADGEARVWNVRTGKPVTPPLTHKDVVVHATFSPAGDSVVTVSADRTAQLWRLPDGVRVGPTLLHGGQVFRAAFDPKGALIVTVSGGDGTLQKNSARLWNAATGEPIGREFEHADIIYTAAFSPDGGRLVTGSEDGTARIWNVKSGEPATPPMVNEDIVLRAGFSPDGRFVFTASLDGTVRLWDAGTGELIARLRRHKQRLNAAGFSPDGRRLLTASDDGTVKISPLPRTDWTIADLTLLAQVLAARQIEEHGTEMEPLNERDFQKAWLSLCQRFPQLFSAGGVAGQPRGDARPHVHE